ncbi:unnamed protein product [Withania somnifera]
MCIQDSEQVNEGMENLAISNTDDNFKNQYLHSEPEFQHPNDENWPKFASSTPSVITNSCPLESISEDTTIADRKQILFSNFLPTLRSGDWSDIGGRLDMEDTHICIADLAKNFGYNILGEDAISFYGVFDGHGGKGASQFVRDYLPKIIVEDADFPLELEKVVTRSFVQTDAAFAKSCSVDSALTRIESVGGFVDDGYLNGQLGVSRALGNWHIKGLKEGEKGGPDGIWYVYRSQNAVDFARRRLQEHNNVKRCYKELSWSEPPPPVVFQRSRIRKSISAEGLENLRSLLEC